MNRTDIINLLASKIAAKSYLEIGIDNGENFKKIAVSQKISVDPNQQSPAIYHLTSDEYFEKHNDKFDLIFIDGLHISEQVTRDINNSLHHLNEGGYIVCHDCNPPTEQHQIVPFQGGGWNGDVWKAIVKLRASNSDVDVYTVDTDHGCSVVTRGKSQLLNLSEELTYYNFDKNRKLWLNLISEQEFINILFQK